MKAPTTKEEFIFRHSAYFQSLGFDKQFAAFIYYMSNSCLNVSGHLLQTKF